MTPPPCVTCKYASTPFHGNRLYSKCLAPESFDPSGFDLEFCTHMRREGKPCGPEGLLWQAKEPRQSWWERIIKRVRG